MEYERRLALEDQAELADDTTRKHVLNPIYLRETMKTLTMIDYKTHVFDHTQYSNIAYLTLYAPTKYQTLFLMEYGRMTKFLLMNAV